MIYCLSVHGINFFQPIRIWFLFTATMPTSLITAAIFFPANVVFTVYTVHMYVLYIVKRNFNSNLSYHQCIEISINLRSKWVVNVSLQWTEERNTINLLIITNIIWELVFSNKYIKIYQQITSVFTYQFTLI